MRALGICLLLLSCAALPLSGLVSQDISERLKGRVPPEIVPVVGEIAASAAARGLPIEPLIQKALEGGAKHAPAERVIAAVRALAVRLADAQGALRDAGITGPRPEVVEGGAYALSAGLSAHQVSDIVRLSRPPYDPVLTLRVAATLAALGVSADRALELVEGRIRAGRASSDVLDLPGEVEAGISRGATAEEAAEGVGSAGRREGEERQPTGEVQPEQQNPNPRHP